MTAEIVLRMLGAETRVPRASAVIGRGSECDVVVEDQGASRQHCEVFLRGDGVYVRDLGSTHGTWVAGARVRGELRIAGRALVHLGERGIPVEVVAARLDGAVLAADGRSVSGLTSRTQSMSPDAIVAARAAAAAAAPRTARPPDAAPRPARSFASGFRFGLAAGAAVALVFVLVRGFGPAAAAARSFLGLG